MVINIHQLKKSYIYQIITIKKKIIIDYCFLGLIFSTLFSVNNYHALLNNDIYDEDEIYDKHCYERDNKNHIGPQHKII